MEEEDEFGDLYTDVISNFPSSSSSAPPPPTPAVDLIPDNLNPEEEEEEEALAIQELNCKPQLAAAAEDPPPPPPTQGDNWGSPMNAGEWGSSDSDSEDDLQIVLNDTNPIHHPHPNNDDDDDGEPLVIVADDTAAAAHPDDLDWTDDSGPPPAPADANKPNPTLTAPPRPPFNSYHPFPSQFKYVRPGATPGGPPAQVRPLLNAAGRGRGGRGFWPPNAPPPRSLDFTLPSHKTIFEVDIDGFEEKPWKYPGVDVSDFFNFSLNEETWKDYCKQLEQLRLESTMQSKIRVYESGRTEQEYDPDLPPELAAAAGIQESSAQNAEIAKADLGDQDKGSTRARLSMPPGRAIQVETGYGERLPSVDTRPARPRDSDAVIEIVLQDSADDESDGNGASKHPDSDSAREDEQVDVVDEGDGHDGDGQSDIMKANVARKRSPPVNLPHGDNDQEGERSPPPHGASSDYHTDLNDRTSIENVGSPCEERSTKETARERSPRMSSGESAFDRRSLDYQREESVDSMEHKLSPASVSPAHARDATEENMEGKTTDDDVPADVKTGKGKADADMVTSAETSKNKRRIHSTKQQLSNRVGSSANEDDGGDLRVSKSSDNNKATGSDRDHQKRRETIDEEVALNGRSTHMADVKRHRGEGGHDLRRKDRDGRVEMDRNYASVKGKEENYSHKDWDPYSGNHFHMKSEGGDRKRERDYSEGSWQRRDEDPHGLRIRPEDARKQERADEMASRHRSKVREFDRNDKDEYLHSRKFLDNGSWRGYHEKDGGLHYREKDDGLKSRHEILDDLHGKRKKDGDYMRRENIDKEDFFVGHRESSSTRGKREKDGALNQRKRDDLPRVRDNYDDHLSVRVKDEVWVQREQLRDRDEWYRAKQSYEESISRRERDDVRVPIKNSRAVDERVWVGPSHGREEYKGHDKDAGRHGEPLKRRERVEDEISFQHRGSEDVHARGNHFASEGKRPRQERSVARNDRAVNASDNHKFHVKKHKDNLKKARESEGHNISASSKRHQGEKGVANDMEAKVKGKGEKGVPWHDTLLPNLSREGKDNGSSDDDQQSSKRGRSKLERWTSHKDRDYDTNSKTSSSLKIKEVSKDRNARSASSAGVRDEPAKDVVAEEGNQSLAAGKENGGLESKDVDATPTDDRRLDTVEKLKRRSERFKLPLASEKDPQAIKKIESEPLPSPQNESPANAEVKHERPPRKRRWITG